MKKQLLTTILLTAIACCQAQTIAEVRSEIVRQGLPHPDIVLAQARLESGNFRSERARNGKNILGIKHGRRYATYKRWQECIADYKERISSRYRQGEDYYAFLRRIGYAADVAYCDKVRHIVRTSRR